LAERLAKEKALAVARQRPGAVVIGSDQVAVCDGRILGKPGTPENALDQLLWQAGKSTDFHTAICLGRLDRQGQLQTSIRTVTTRVVWRSKDELTTDRLSQYIACENPVDCAGAAKSEGLGITLIHAFEGPDPTALVGLPLIALTEMLSAWGLDPLLPPGSPPGSAQ
jgi:septum formation protein